jgi:hypothetical protein
MASSASRASSGTSSTEIHCVPSLDTICSVMSLTNSANFGVLATKSVSQPTSISTPLVPPVWM